MSLAEVNRSHVGKEGYHGSPTEFFGHAIVGFVDILGFSASVDRSWSDTEQSSLARLLRIKEATKKIPDQKAIRHVPGGEKPPVIDACRVHTISDSIVVCAALPETGTFNDMLAALGAVSHSMQAAWVAAIAEGFSARGAIELGQIYWTEHETVGPAFNHAYRLESEIAKTSRLIVGPDCLSKLLEILERDNLLDQWLNWPPAHWLTVSGGRFQPNLIELNPHLVWHTYRSSGETLESIAKTAGANSWRYEQILARLREDAPSPPATIEELRRGRDTLLSLLRPKPKIDRFFSWVCRF